jgi:ATP-dependent Clp protease ATP-binding subunit ClpB
MRMDKLTSRFQQALQDAQSLAVGRDHNLLEPVHVLNALIEQQGGSVRPLLTKAGANVPVIRQRLAAMLDALPKVKGQEGSLGIGNDLTRLLNLSDKLAQERGDQFIASELFALAASDDKGELGQLLRNHGATKPVLAAAIDQLRGGEAVQDANAEEHRQALDKYTIDFTRRAETASSIRSSAARRRSRRPSKCWPGARRTTRC